MPRNPLSIGALALALATAGLTLAGCGSGEPSGTEAQESAIQVVNGAGVPVSVRVDGAVQVAELAAGAISPVIRVSVGAHTVVIASGTGSGSASVAAVRGGVHAVTATSAAGAIAAQLLPDTASVPAPGTAKLRVVHLAAGAPAISVWRTQPGVAGSVQVMFPFRYGAESSFIQGDPGSWRVWVAPLQEIPPATPNDTATYIGVPTPELASSGPIALAAGDVRTAVLLRDASGALRFELLAGAP